MDDFDRELKRSLTNIHEFSRKILHFNPSAQQEELFDLIQWETFAPLDKCKRGIFVKSGNGTGKTAASVVVMLFRHLQAINNKGLVIAPTKRQVQDVWLTEVAKQLAKADYRLQQRIDVQATRVRMRGFMNWNILTATSSRVENIQGYHDASLTILADEASGIQRKIWPAMKGTMTEAGNLLVGIGNPNTRNTEFFDAFNKDAYLYHNLTWNAEQSSNVDWKHIEKMRNEYGIDSDMYRVRVLGEFPHESAHAIIRYEDLLHACRTTSFLEAMTWIPLKETKQHRQFGIDLARFGGAESVIVARFNSAMVGMKRFNRVEPNDVIEQAIRWQRELGWADDTVYCVDASGVGQGCLDRLYSTGKNVFEFHSHGTPFEGEKYSDRITEAYFNLRALTRDRRIHLKEDDIGFGQLVAREYRYHVVRKRSVYKIESKDEFIERVGEDDFESPDRADALAMAFYPYTDLPAVS